jgi:drug/metabolite transporter (DMT)-like permease
VVGPDGVRSTPLYRLAFASLLLGAVGIAFAPLFVRWSEVGPSATAFHRVLLALPFLWAWQAFRITDRSDPNRSGAVGEMDGARLVGQGNPNRQGAGRSSGFTPWLLLPGLFFAADLALWHWSIRLTSVANATLFANLAPIVVMIAARFLFQERIRPRFLLGLGLALGGASLVVGSSFGLTQRHVLGDLFGLATALFYAGYMLSVKFVRRTHDTLVVMIWSSLAAAPILLLIAALSRETLLPVSGTGWLVLIGLALVSQVGGQGLITFAFRHLPASFSALSLLLQPVVAAALAWLLLSEPLTPLQSLGGVFVLAGIAVANRTTADPTPGVSAIAARDDEPASRPGPTAAN